VGFVVVGGGMFGGSFVLVGHMSGGRCLGGGAFVLGGRVSEGCYPEGANVQWGGVCPGGRCTFTHRAYLHSLRVHWYDSGCQ